jgi:hypothetical protein
VFGAVCYIETHEPDRYAGHFRASLGRVRPHTPLFDIERATDRRIEVTFTLDSAAVPRGRVRRSRRFRCEAVSVRLADNIAPIELLTVPSGAFSTQQAKRPSLVAADSSSSA